VKKLEELGIGRPSTYATILQVLQDRGYAKLIKKFFVPEVRGRLVTAFLTNFFNRYLEYGFTADLEQSLDDVSNGNKSKLEILKNFWREFCENVDKTKDIKISDVINKLNETLGEFLFRTEDGISRICPECKSGELSLKMGRYGSFLGCSRYPNCGYIKKLDSSQTLESEDSIASSSEYPKVLGNDPADNGEISLRKGPYGLYIQKNLTPIPSKKKAGKEKPPRASIPNFINPANIDLNLAISLLKFPKTLGKYENEDIKIGIGRFGPYVLFKGKYASAPKSEIIFTMTLDDAVQLIKSKQK
jgi:DNA topoisomerase-1